MFWFRRVAQNQGLGGFMSIGRSKAKIYVESDTKTTFKDVAGVDEAKEELQEIVQFLKNPAESSRLGARVPKGVLLVGAAPEPARLCWRARLPARPGCRSFPSTARNSSRCSWAWVRRACGICSSKLASARPRSSS